MPILKNIPIPRDTAVFGEVGLSGEVRSVGHAMSRIKEAKALGFNTVVLPKGNRSTLEKEGPVDIKIMGVENIGEALKILF